MVEYDLHQASSVWSPSSELFIGFESFRDDVFRLLQEDSNSSTATNTSSNTNSTTTTNALSDGEILRVTFTIYGSLLLVGFTVFCMVRILFPRAYTIRQWVDEIKTTLATNQFGYISWIWNITLFTEDEILNECGMDSLCYIRLLKMGYRISCVSAVNAIWLMPVYKYSESSSETSTITDPIVQVSITNVPSGSSRFIATAVAAYVLFGYIMYLILQEFEWYTEYRHKYLAKLVPRNYSIFVRHIPMEYRTNGGLETFFKQCFDSTNIYETQLATNCKQLHTAIQTRETIIEQLEHAVAYEEKYDQHCMVRIKKLNTTTGVTFQKVRAVQYYADELIAINEDISNRILKVESKETVALPTTVSGSSSSAAGSTTTTTNNNNNNNNNASQYLLNATNHTLKKMNSLISNSQEGDYLDSGFVSFTNLGTTNAALQMIHHETPFTIEVLNAPDPDDIFWDNIGYTHKQIQIGSLISTVGTIALCFLWTIPMAFLSTISSVEQLKNYDFIANMIEKVPWIEPILQMIAPLFVLLINSILPMLLRFLSMTEGPISASVVEASLFSKLAAFTIIQTFFVSFIGGSLIPQLKHMVDDPWAVIDLLAEVLPGKSTYFIQILFASNSISLIFEILRVLPIVYDTVRRCLGPHLTEKERQRPIWFGIVTPLSYPIEFEQAANLATIVLNYMVLLVYAVIAPITSFIVGFGLAFMYVCFLHQFVYIYPTMPDSGGKIWAYFIKVLMSCMVISEVTIIGLMSLKKATIATPLMFPLLAITILFNGYVRQQHFRVGEYLPSRLCLKIDTQRNQQYYHHHHSSSSSNHDTNTIPTNINHDNDNNDRSINNNNNIDSLDHLLKDVYQQVEYKTKCKYPELTENQLELLQRQGIYLYKQQQQQESSNNNNS